MSVRLYRLRPPEPPWGDYGDVLIHGWAGRSESGSLELERVGPFMPPISLPDPHIVITDELLQLLRRSDLTGYDVGPVVKKKVTMVDWRQWEPWGPEEMKYPVGGEPENYILRRKHSAKAAEALGKIWELRFRPCMQVSRDGGYHVVASSWDGSDFVVENDEKPIYRFVTERAREWLIEHVPEWVAFEEVRVK